MGYCSITDKRAGLSYSWRSLRGRCGCWMSCPLVRQRNPFYLFPFLSGRRTGEAAYKEYNRTLSRFNRDLKLLARSTGVTLPVTSYTIRHSFASFLKEQDVSIEVISELLGHKSIKTTQIYLKSFSLERLSTVNRNCFESVCKPIPKVG
mgnify:CR=1 FL=1